MTAATGRLKVRQTRSAIGSLANQRETLRSLGLKRIGDVVVKEDRPEIRGMVHAVRHLVAVDVVEEGTAGPGQIEPGQIEPGQIEEGQ